MFLALKFFFKKGLEKFKIKHSKLGVLVLENGEITALI